MFFVIQTKTEPYCSPFMSSINNQYREQLLVFGFIRNCQSLLPNLIIPSPLYLIFFDYYYISDLFGKHSPCIEVSGDGNDTIKANTSDRCCAYGYQWIDSISNKLIKYEVRINRCDPFDSATMIGITTDDSNINCAFRQTTEKQIFYAFDNDGDKYWHDAVSYRSYGDTFEQGDVVRMELNLSTGTIIYYINDESQGIAFKDIEKGDDIKYKLAVELYNDEDSCTIISHSEECLL